MKKVLGQALFVVFLGYFLNVSFAAHSALPITHVSTAYKLFKPIFQALGYRPLKVHVFDQETGEPISDAVVMIGDREDSPFAGNWQKTNRYGNVSFDGAPLPEEALAVTVRHQDYSGFTLFSTEATELKIPLSRLEDTLQKTQINGNFTGWPPMEDNDGTIHIGFVLPFVDIVSLINFSTDKLLAPYVKAQIYKEVKVPGNLVIPEQEERYLGFIPVYVSKPEYQIPLVTGSHQNMIALAGHLPFSKFAKGMINKKPLPELLNLITLDQVGMVLNYHVPEESLRRDIHLALTSEERFQVSVINAPVNKDIIHLSLGSFQNEVGSVFPLDYKVSGREQGVKTATLRSLREREQFSDLKDWVVILAIDLPKQSGSGQKTDSAMVGGIQRPTPTAQQVSFDQYLELFDLSHHDMTEFSFQTRSAEVSTLSPDMNLSFLNIVLPDTKDAKGHQQMWWTVIAPPEMKAFSLPKLPQGLSTLPRLEPSEQLEWVLNRFAIAEADNIPFNYHNFDDKIIAERLEHFSMNDLVLMKAQVRP